jgi:hypothetical protein
VVHQSLREERNRIRLDCLACASTGSKCLGFCMISGSVCLGSLELGSELEDELTLARIEAQTAWVDNQSVLRPES